ncbi:MAG: DUF4125 family protein [Clostridiales bacterium]|nr:DUF4125 family protein [Clostridiales bacterium]
MTAKEKLIEKIIDQEWWFFSQVEGIDGRAVCQDRPKTFRRMRRAQHAIFSEATLNLLLNDYLDYQDLGRNPIAEKYAWMMRQTDPTYFAQNLAPQLVMPSPVKVAAIQELADFFALAQQEFSQNRLARQVQGRVEQSGYGEVSSLDYLTGELETWSLGTLYSALQDMQKMSASGRNPVLEIVCNTVKDFKGATSDG